MAITNEEVASSLMRKIDERLAASALDSSWARDRYLEILGLLIGELEIAMNSVKDGGR